MFRVRSWGNCTIKEIPQIIHCFKFNVKKVELWNDINKLRSFNEPLSKILSPIKPSTNAIIMGDFNIHLLSTNKCSSSFEEHILCNGFSPIISTVTHQKPKFQTTCIDNIFSKQSRLSTEKLNFRNSNTHTTNQFISRKTLPLKHSPTDIRMRT